MQRKVVGLNTADVLGSIDAETLRFREKQRPKLQPDREFPEFTRRIRCRLNKWGKRLTPQSGQGRIVHQTTHMKDIAQDSLPLDSSTISIKISVVNHFQF